MLKSSDKDLDYKYVKFLVFGISLLFIFGFYVALSFTSLLCLLAGIFFLVGQIIIFFQKDLWIGITVIDLLRDTLKINWAIEPKSWYGLYRALEHTPLTPILFVLGIPFLIIIRDRFWERSIYRAVFGSEIIEWLESRYGK